MASKMLLGSVALTQDLRKACIQDLHDLLGIWCWYLGAAAKGGSN